MRLAPVWATILGLCVALYSATGASAELSRAAGATARALEAAAIKGKALKSRPRSLVTPVKIILEDNRVSPLEFVQQPPQDETEALFKEAADKFFAQFDAIGELDCPWINLSGQLTEVSDIVTTAGHAFFDEACRPRDYSVCRFHIRRGDELITRQIKPGSVEAGTCRDGDRMNDWAFFQLDQPVPGVRPMFAPENPIQLRGGDKILHVSWDALNYETEQEDTRHVQICQVMVSDPSSFTTPLQTDCDTGRGSSGGAQLIVHDQGLTIAAINNSELISFEESEHFKDRKRDFTAKSPFEKKPFRMDHYANVSAPLTGNFFKRLWNRIDSLPALRAAEDPTGTATRKADTGSATGSTSDVDLSIDFELESEDQN